MIIGSLTLGASVSGGIVIFPFIPVPVVFGFGPEATLMAIIAIVIAIALIVAMIAITKTIRF